MKGAHPDGGTVREGSAARTIFITGTDTGVGKTRVSCGLLRAAREQGIRACGYKPVAAGCRKTADGWVNSDARQLQKASGRVLPLDRINPYTLRRPIAPHLAARVDGVDIDLRRLDTAHAWLARRHELVIVEGAGGWQVPLDDRATMADWVSGRQWPVMLVVGMRLGCLNHALLTARSIASGTRLLGWVANVLPPRMPALTANIEDLRNRLEVPLLGVIRGDERPFAGVLREILVRA